MYRISDIDVLASATGERHLLVVAAMLVLLLVSRRLGMLFFVTAFPATLAHELTHLVVGLLTYGQPSGLRLIPLRRDRGYALGSVTCRNVRWYNGLFIGLAPLLLLPLALILLLARVRSGAAFDAAELGWSYAVACLTYASLPSWQDLRVAIASSWLILALLLVAAAANFPGLPHLR
jgi:uncharacterized membrane protein YczE